jgi:tight adherence protein B
MDVLIGSLVLLCLVLAGEAHGHSQADRISASVGQPPGTVAGMHGSKHARARWDAIRLLRGTPTRAAAMGLVGAVLGARLVGPPGVVVCGALGAALPFALRRTKEARRAVSLERQLAELVEGAATAIRSGLSVTQAIQVAGVDIPEPMAGLLRGFAAERQVGATFDEALSHLGEAVGTDDARLFVLVVRIHARSGGNLAPALDEVATAIRHRIAVRRELRALSAQGRISGLILGSLPIAFFLVIGTTSHRELAPVYRTPAGMVMVGLGLALEGVAFVWIRRLLHVRV